MRAALLVMDFLVQQQAPVAYTQPTATILGCPPRSSWTSVVEQAQLYSHPQQSAGPSNGSA